MSKTQIEPKKLTEQIKFDMSVLVYKSDRSVLNF